jgi:hypothetical protein
MNSCSTQAGRGVNRNLKRTASAGGLKRRPSRGPASGREGAGPFGGLAAPPRIVGAYARRRVSVNGPNVQLKRRLLGPWGQSFPPVAGPRSELADAAGSRASARAAERRLSERVGLPGSRLALRGKENEPRRPPPRGGRWSLARDGSRITDLDRSARSPQPSPCRSRGRGRTDLAPGSGRRRSSP